MEAEDIGVSNQLPLRLRLRGFRLRLNQLRNWVTTDKKRPLKSEGTLKRANSISPTIALSKISYRLFLPFKSSRICTYGNPEQPEEGYNYEPPNEPGGLPDLQITATPD